MKIYIMFWESHKAYIFVKALHLYSQKNYTFISIILQLCSENIKNLFSKHFDFILRRLEMYYQNINFILVTL